MLRILFMHNYFVQKVNFLICLGIKPELQPPPRPVNVPGNQVSCCELWLSFDVCGACESKASQCGLLACYVECREFQKLYP